MRKLVVLTGLAALTFLIAQSSCTKQQSSSEELKALSKEIETLKATQTAMQKDLEEIKGALRARPAQPGAAPRDIALDIKGKPFKGNKSGKVVLVEFSDYQ
jgi:protein-disulfide isomerase